MWGRFWGCWGRLSRWGWGCGLGVRGGFSPTPPLPETRGTPPAPHRGSAPDPVHGCGAGGFLPHPAPSRNRGHAPGPPLGLRPRPRPGVPPLSPGSDPVRGSPPGPRPGPGSGVSPWPPARTRFGVLPLAPGSASYLPGPVRVVPLRVPDQAHRPPGLRLDASCPDLVRGLRSASRTRLRHPAGPRPGPAPGLNPWTGSEAAPSLLAHPVGVAARTPVQGASASTSVARAGRCKCPILGAGSRVATVGQAGVDVDVEVRRMSGSR